MSISWFLDRVKSLKCIVICCCSCGCGCYWGTLIYCLRLGFVLELIIILCCCQWSWLEYLIIICWLIIMCYVYVLIILGNGILICDVLNVAIIVIESIFCSSYWCGIFLVFSKEYWFCCYCCFIIYVWFIHFKF